jgi:hypothetical protein
MEAMRSNGTSGPQAARPAIRRLAALAVLVSAFAVISTMEGHAESSWQSRVSAAAERFGIVAGKQRSGTLEAAAAALARLAAPQNKGDGPEPAPSSTKEPATAPPALAAEVTQEGHWTFINRAGERFTAASPDELKRAVSTLTSGAPGGTQGGAAVANPARLIVLLTEDTVFKFQPRLKDLPADADLRLVTGSNALPLRRRGDIATAPLFAEVRPNLLIAASNRALFDDTVWQLDQGLKSAHVRVLAMEPGGPQTLAGAPKLDPATRRPLVDQIDPLRAASSLAALRGQTAIVIGRIDGKLLYVRGSSGPEQSVIVDDLVQAAEASDVNLLLLQSPNARQPGARNWLWQKAEVVGLDDALARARLSDFLNALGSGERPLAITAAGPEPGSPRGRITLTVTPDATPSLLDSVAPVSRTTDAISDAIGGVVSGLTGKLVIGGARLHLMSRERAGALQGRLLPGIPIGWIEAYLVAALLGLLGWGWTSRWWQRLWPREARGDYASAAGYQAARLARSFLMVLLFVPVAGVGVVGASFASLFSSRPPRGTKSNARVTTAVEKTGTRP